MNLHEQLACRIQGRVVILGIGNSCRGDDGAGSRVAQRVCPAQGVCVIDAQEVPENYLGQVENWRPDTIVLIDAVGLSSPAGSVALLDGNQTKGYFPSTHRVPVTMLAEYFERITHARVFVIAVQPSQTDLLQPMSAEVLSSVSALVATLNGVLERRTQFAIVE